MSIYPKIKHISISLKSTQCNDDYMSKLQEARTAIRNGLTVQVTYMMRGSALRRIPDHKQTVTALLYGFADSLKDVGSIIREPHQVGPRMMFVVIAPV